MIRPANENTFNDTADPPFRRTLPERKSHRTPSSEVDREQLRKLIRNNLSSTERLILISHYVTQMNEHEIASTLDLSPEKVSQSLDLMKAKIREMCREYKSLKVA